MSQKEWERELTRDERDLLVQLAHARRSIRDYEEIERKCKEQLASSMDIATHGLVNGVHVVTISRTRPDRFDSIRFRRDYELLAQSYMVASEHDVIRVTVQPAAYDLDGG